jgi:hypothetical protein
VAHPELTGLLEMGLSDRRDPGWRLPAANALQCHTAIGSRIHEWP